MPSLDFNLDLSQNDSVSDAASALSRIRTKRNDQLIQESKLEDISNIKRKRDLVEEFTDSSMDSKLKTDAFFYETLLVKVDNSEDVQTAISEMVEAQVNFYKILNVSPVMNHFTEHELVNNSESTNISKATTIIETYLRENLFSLSAKKRNSKYESDVLPLAESYVSDYSVSNEKAVDLAYKTIVTENLLKYIQASVYVNLYYEDCLTSDYYSEFFELDLLKESYATYMDTVHTAAQIIALTL